jgi:transcriptional regulator with XRE-family HTH domain
MSELKQERESLRLTQAEAAKRMGVRSNTWARWERGERTMGEVELRLWARIAVEAGQEAMSAGEKVRASIEETE